jgi:hypothetical protein
MYRFTTDVIASSASGVDSNSLANSDVEFESYLRKLLVFIRHSVSTPNNILRSGFAELLQAEIMDDDIPKFLRSTDTVWNTVRYK